MKKIALLCAITTITMVAEVRMPISRMKYTISRMKYEINEKFIELATKHHHAWKAWGLEGITFISYSQRSLIFLPVMLCLK